jgi:hypothetical protein
MIWLALVANHFCFIPSALRAVKKEGAKKCVALPPI